MQYVESVNKLTQKVGEIALKKPQDVAKAEALLQEIHIAEKTLLAHKEEVTRPIMTGLSQIREMFKTPEQNLAGLKKEVKAKILAHHEFEDAKKKVKEDRILARQAKGTMRSDTAIAKIEELASEPTSGNIRVVRKLEIYDDTLLPRIFLVADREAITRALFSGVDIPGARLKEEKTVAVGRV